MKATERQRVDISPGLHSHEFFNDLYDATLRHALDHFRVVEFIDGGEKLFDPDVRRELLFN